MIKQEIQKIIDATDYWDMRILNLEISYFGDEVELIIDNDEETCWKISFLMCYKVLYETDVLRRKNIYVRNMKEAQLAYYGQDISVSESEADDCYKVDLDLSIMEMHIDCKEILVQKISKNYLYSIRN